jgi:hypothetical protein
MRFFLQSFSSFVSVYVRGNSSPILPIQIAGDRPFQSRKLGSIPTGSLSAADNQRKKYVQMVQKHVRTWYK